MIENSSLILSTFTSLDAARRNRLIREFSSDERKLILKIIKNNGNCPINENDLNNLNSKIQKANSLKINATRRNYSKTYLSLAKKNLINFVDSVSYGFNFLTAHRAIDLIRQEINRQHYASDLPRVSTKKLLELAKEAQSLTETNEKIDLAKVLESNGFSTEITDIKFSDEFSLNNMSLTGIKFANCKFEWTQCSGSVLSDVLFSNCTIDNLSLMNSKLENCMFQDCKMREVMFTGANLENVIFERSSLISSSFEDASLNKCLFVTVSMPATHFLDAAISDTQIALSNLENAVFFGTSNQFAMDTASKKTAVITRPTTAILVHPGSRGITTPKAFMKLDQSAGVLGLRITMQAQKTMKDEVNQEVEEALKTIQEEKSKGGAPIAQQLIQEFSQKPDSETAKILKKAEKLAAEVDSFFLPGGEDVPPALYGKEKEEKTDWGGDYRRSILELGIIHQSFNRGIPLMAVCRGFQMSNVYFGAQLIQHIDGHKGIQKFELSTPEKVGLFSEAMQSSILSASFHHQGILEENANTQHLEIAVRYEGLVKAAALKESGSVPMILLQFHPEFYKADTADSITREFIDTYLEMHMSKENELFWNILSESAEGYRVKLAALPQIKSKDDGKSIDIDKIIKIEDKRSKIFDVYSKGYYDWKKGLLDVVEKDPEKLLRRYLTPSRDGETDHFPEEREILEKTLREDVQYTKSLLGDPKKRENIIQIIKESSPTLFNEMLEKGLLNVDTISPKE